MKKANASMLAHKCPYAHIKFGMRENISQKYDYFDTTKDGTKCNTKGANIILQTYQGKCQSTDSLHSPL